MVVYEVAPDDLLVVVVPEPMTEAETKHFASAWSESAARGVALLSGECEFLVVKDGRKNRGVQCA